MKDGYQMLAEGEKMKPTDEIFIYPCDSRRHEGKWTPNKFGDFSHAAVPKGWAGEVRRPILAAELTRLRAELETERRKVKVAKVALKKLWDFPFFGAADSLGRMNLDETADRMRALSAVVGNALAALTPSEKGEL